MYSYQEMVEKIIAEYEATSDNNKLFVFGVTMQNHGGYDYNENKFNSVIHVEEYGERYPEVEQYLSLLHETDKSIEH